MLVKTLPKEMNTEISFKKKSEQNPVLLLILLNHIKKEQNRKHKLINYKGLRKNPLYTYSFVCDLNF